MIMEDFNFMDTFEEFLEEKFWNDYSDIKDNAEVALEHWFENLDVQELIDYGQEYAKYVEYETVSNIQDKLCTQTLKLHDELKNFNK